MIIKGIITNKIKNIVLHITLFKYLVLSIQLYNYMIV